MCKSHCRQQQNLHSAKVIKTSAYNPKGSVVNSLFWIHAQLLALTTSCALGSHPHTAEVLAKLWALAESYSTDVLS